MSNYQTRLTCISPLKVWINKLTGEVSDTDPTVLESDSNASTSTNSSLMAGTLAYNTRRNALAERGKIGQEGLAKGNCFR